MDAESRYDCDLEEDDDSVDDAVESPQSNFYYAPHLPTQLGDLLEDRYYVESLLSDGTMSNVWLCWDLKGIQQVVVKIGRECEDSNAMIQHEHVMLSDANNFDLQSPHRERIVEVLGAFQLDTLEQSLNCLVLEAMDGTLMDLIGRDDKRLPLTTVKNISIQILEGLDYLHKCQIIHSDIKPENVFFSYIDESRPIVRIKLGDLGNSCKRYCPFSDIIQTPPYRAVEVILGAGYDTSSDIWSAACVIFEMITSDYLFDFDCKDPVTFGFPHLKLIIQILGTIPFTLLARGKYSQAYFNENCDLRDAGDIYPDCIRNILIEMYNVPIADAEPLAWFLEYMLQLNPDERPSAQECLLHDWLS